MVSSPTVRIYRIRQKFSNQANDGITCTLHNKRRLSKLCRQHSTTSAVTRIQYFKIELCGGTVNKTEMLVFILFGTAYEIKIVTGKRWYNSSCQTLGYSSQVNEQSQAILSSPVKRSPRTETLPEQ